MNPENPFTDKKVINIEDASWWEWFRLLFLPLRMFETKLKTLIITYKVLDEKAFIYDVIEPPPFHWNCRCGGGVDPAI